ncbi:MAG: citrate synthase, partial [Pseudomonadota bacterium]
MTTPKHQQVRSRNEKFAEKTATRIWSEQATEDNPYIAESALCHGYDLFELVDQCSFVQVLYLLYRGELPSKDQEKLLESLMI